MPRHPHFDDLCEIESRDPAGDEARTTSPTNADYAAHKQWAIETYGVDVWQVYTTESWGLFGTDPV